MFTTVPTRSASDLSTYQDINSLMDNTQYFKDAITIDGVNVGVNKTTNIGTLVSMAVGGTVVHIDGDTSIANLILEGDLGGRFLLADTNATADLQIVGLYNQSGKTFFRSLDDDGTTNIDNIIAMDHATGDVGIGMVPAYQFQLSTSEGYKSAGTAWQNPSDERLKENIELADLDICYDNIKNIPLKRYTWRSFFSDKEIGDRTKVGWIAQDVEPIFPKSTPKKDLKIKEKDAKGNVVKDKDGNDVISEIITECLSFDADQIYAAMYGAIQKLIEKVEALEG